MNTPQETPPGYDKHVIRAKAQDLTPMSPEEWVKVCEMMDELPGTMDDPVPKEMP